MPPKHRPKSVILGPETVRHRRESPFSPHTKTHTTPTRKTTPKAPAQKAKPVITRRSDHEKKVEELRRQLMEKREERLESHPEHKAKKKSKINWKQIGMWAAIIIVAIIIWNLIDVKGILLDILQRNPAVWSAYRAIQAEIEARTLVGLLYASFFGSLFFLSIPVEVIFLYYLGLNYYFVQVVTIVMIGNLIGMLFNYACGWLIGERVIQFFMKKNYKKFKRKIDRAGIFIILIGNIIPFPIEPFTVFLGAIRYSFRKFLLYTFIGKVAKFLLLWIGYTYFVKFVGPYLSGVSVDWFITTIQNIFVFW